MIFLVIIPIIVIVFCIRANISIWWEESGRDYIHSKNQFCSSCIDSCCCPFMKKVNRTLSKTVPFGRKSYISTRSINSTNSSENSELKIDINVEAIDNQTSSWGVANDTLITDFIKVTPNSSPNLRRKLKMRSESPESLRPEYFKSMSKDSGCVSDDNNEIGNKGLSSSLSSLLSIVKKFGKSSRLSYNKEENDISIHSRSREGSLEPPNRNKKFGRYQEVRGQSVEPEQSTSLKTKGNRKSLPLSRIVIDPLSDVNNKRSKASANPYKRSVSTDATVHHAIKPMRPPPLVPINKDEKSSSISKNISVKEAIRNKPLKSNSIQDQNTKTVKAKNVFEKRNEVNINNLRAKPDQNNRIAQLKKQLDVNSSFENKRQNNKPNFEKPKTEAKGISVKDRINEIKKNNGSS